MPEPISPDLLEPAKKNIFTGLTSWQLLLSVFPVGLLFFGGAIGGAIGAAGMLTNVKIAKSPLATPVKVLAMVGVVLAAVVVNLAVAVLITSALK